MLLLDQAKDKFNAALQSLPQPFARGDNGYSETRKSSPWITNLISLYEPDSPAYPLSTDPSTPTILINNKS